MRVQSTTQNSTNWIWDVGEDFVDRNNNNIEFFNTVCLYCAKLISIEGLGWAQGDLVPDF